MEKSALMKTLVGTTAKRERKTFKRLLHGKKPAILQTFAKSKIQNARSKTLHGTIKSLDEEVCAENAEGMNVAIAINSFSGKHRRSEVAGINCLVIDDDSGTKTAAFYQNLTPKPHAIVETSPGKFHVYWLIDDCKVGESRLLQMALASHFESDPNIADATRVMRLPGTYNWKTNPPFLCRIVYLDKKLPPYKVKTLVDGFELKVITSNGLDGKAGVALAPALARANSKWKGIDAALADIPNQERLTWLKVGMGIKSIDSGEDGYERWDRWSKSSDKYNPHDQRSTWDGLKPGGIGAGSLIFLAKIAKQGAIFLYDEMTLADLFVHTFANELRFEILTNTWYHFNGVVWTKERGAPLQCAQRLMQDLSKAAAESAPSSALARFRTVAGMKAIIGQAELSASIHIRLDEFDAQPHLLAVQNGVYDLQLGNFRPALATDYLCLQADVAFDENATAPAWGNFLEQVTGGDRGLQRYLARFAGYTLWGHSLEQKFFVLIGTGGNGKGTFTRTLKEVLGEYAVTIAPNVLTKAYSGSPNSPSPALAQLAGARMILCGESGAGKAAKFDEAFIKQIAGGDELSARNTYGDMHTFKPVAKLVLTTNYAPEYPRTDKAMWRRFKPIPFKVDFLGEKMDEKLESVLLTESSGILNWMLQGAMQYAEKGLGTCKVVDDTIETMKASADTVASWLIATTRKSANAKTPAALAYSSYCKFVKDSQQTVLPIKAFKNRLVEIPGISSGRANSGNFYTGFRIRE